jgi:hypothetical protein
MGVVRETCVKYPGGPTRIRGTGICFCCMLGGSHSQELQPKPNKSIWLCLLYKGGGEAGAPGRVR